MGGVRFLKKWQPSLFPCPEKGRGPCDPAQSLVTDSVPGAAIPPAAGGFFSLGPPPWPRRTPSHAPLPGASKELVIGCQFLWIEAAPGSVIH